MTELMSNEKGEVIYDRSHEHLGTLDSMVHHGPRASCSRPRRRCATTVSLPAERRQRQPRPRPPRDRRPAARRRLGAHHGEAPQRRQRAADREPDRAAPNRTGSAGDTGGVGNPHPSVPSPWQGEGKGRGWTPPSTLDNSQRHGKKSVVP